MAIVLQLHDIWRWVLLVAAIVVVIKALIGWLGKRPFTKLDDQLGMAFVTIRFNLQKWVIIIATSLAGAGVIFGAFVILFAPHAALLENPVKVALQQSPLLMITALIVAAFGIYVQARANRNYTLESYNRWAEPV